MGAAVVFVEEICSEQSGAGRVVRINVKTTIDGLTIDFILCSFASLT
jgi:hypothetical protein